MFDCEIGDMTVAEMYEHMELIDITEKLDEKETEELQAAGYRVCVIDRQEFPL